MRITVDVFHHDNRLTLNKLDALQERMESIMATLQELVDKVTVVTTKIGSIEELLYQIKAKLDEELAGELTAEQQAKVDAMFVELTENVDKIDKAITDNTLPTP